MTQPERPLICRNPSFSLAFLERRQRDRYSPKIIQEHTGELLVGYEELESPAPRAGSAREAKLLAESASVESDQANAKAKAHTDGN